MADKISIVRWREIHECLRLINGKIVLYLSQKYYYISLNLGIGLPKFLKFGKSGSSDIGGGGVVLLSKTSLDESMLSGKSSGGVSLLSKQSLGDDSSLCSQDSDGIILVSKRPLDPAYSTDSISMDGKSAFLKTVRCGISDKTFNKQ